MSDTPKILIAYDNRSSGRDFFEGCHDEARDTLVSLKLNYTTISPPDLTEANVIKVMEEHTVCFIAAHGKPDGIYNDSDEDVISTRTTNYNFEGKGLYTISCSCGENLYPELNRIGLQFFVGYNKEFKIRGDIDPFVRSAISGFECILRGMDINEVRAKMSETFDKEIERLRKVGRKLDAIYLLDNKEALVCEGCGKPLANDVSLTLT